MGVSEAVKPVPTVLDFRFAGMKPNGKPEIDKRGRKKQDQGGRPITSSKKKQIRARARRARKISTDAMEQLYKPVSEWDAEELAKGRPKAADGSFRGRTPPWIDRTVHEEILKQFEHVIRHEMNGHTIRALTVLEQILESDAVDLRGKPLVDAGTKLSAAKFLVEHVLGKPKQRTETDISLKLQGILGVAMVNPTAEPETFELAQGYTEVEGWEADDDD